MTKYQEIEQNLYLSPIEVGATAKLNNIFFEVNKSVLKPESFSELDRLIVLLKKEKTLKIEISGHTDATGTDAINTQLSADRAKAVYTYVSAKGITLDKLTYKGYGKTKPVSSNDTEQGRQQNRRVEFTIIGR